MKQFLLFLLIFPFLTACPPTTRDTRDEALKAFSKNDCNLKPLRKTGYRKITFEVPEILENDYNKEHVYRNTALTLVEYQIGINFTVERFFESDIFTELMAKQVITTNLLNGFHDAYVARRLNSQSKGSSTFKKKLYHPLKYEGIIQMVTFDNEYDYQQQLYYATATMKIDSEYYVFQFIAEKKMMQYLYDDFERLLMSVRKIK